MRWCFNTKHGKLLKRWLQYRHYYCSGHITWHAACLKEKRRIICKLIKIRKSAKIRNRYNQAPLLTQDTNEKVTTSQLDTTNESQEVSSFPAGDHKASINRRAHEIITKQDRNPQKKHRLGTVSTNILLEGFNQFHG